MMPVFNSFLVVDEADIYQFHFVGEAVHVVDEADKVFTTFMWLRLIFTSCMQLMRLIFTNFM